MERQCQLAMLGLFWGKIAFDSRRIMSHVVPPRFSLQTQTQRSASPSDVALCRMLPLRLQQRVKLGQRAI